MHEWHHSHLWGCPCFRIICGGCLVNLEQQHYRCKHHYHFYDDYLIDNAIGNPIDNPVNNPVNNFDSNSDAICCFIGCRSEQ